MCQGRGHPPHRSGGAGDPGPAGRSARRRAGTAHRAGRPDTPW
nr:MAG TPA: hypothetical protein [Caudoviricetes sp.]